MMIKGGRRPTTVVYGWPVNDVASELKSRLHTQLDRDYCQEAPSDRVDMWIIFYLRSGDGELTMDG